MALALGRGVVRVSRGLSKIVPRRAKEALDDRVFYAVHQLTRVTNDHYPGTGMDSPRDEESPRGEE